MMIDREVLIHEAKKVLDSSFQGTELAQIMNMNLNQFYDYRSGTRDVSKARLENLIKFDKAYKFIESKQKEFLNTEKGSNKNGTI